MHHDYGKEWEKRREGSTLPHRSKGTLLERRTDFLISFLFPRLNTWALILGQIWIYVLFAPLYMYITTTKQLAKIQNELACQFSWRCLGIRGSDSQIPNSKANNARTIGCRVCTPRAFAIAPTAKGSMAAPPPPIAVANPRAAT